MVSVVLLIFYYRFVNDYTLPIETFHGIFDSTKNSLLFQGLNVADIAEALVDGNLAKKIVAMHRIFVESVLKFKPGERGIVTNGRVYGPFDSEETFVADDFALLDRLSYNHIGQKIFQGLNKDKKSTTEEGE